MSTSQFLSKRAPTFRRPRAGLALGLAALLLFAAQGFKVSAQRPALVEADADDFVTYRDAKGRTVCRGATAEEKRQLRAIKTEHLGLHHLRPEKRESDFQAQAQAVEPQKIILRGTPQLENYPEAKAAFIRAALIWEQQIRSPIKIYIDVDYGQTFFGGPWGNPFALGSTSVPRGQAHYSGLRTSLIERASTPEEFSLYSSLPEAAIPTNTVNQIMVFSTGPVFRTLGYMSPTADEADPAPRIGFNSIYQFDFDPSDGIDSDKFDFEAVAAHEIGHALGFISNAGSTDDPPTIWDLFRFRAGTTLETFGSAPRIMTADGPQFYFSGGADLPLSTGGPNGQALGGDGNQSSHWKESRLNGGRVVGIMDARLAAGTRRQLSYNDALALNFLGYDVDMSKAPPPQPWPPPPANDYFASAEVLAGCAGSLYGTNVSATQEVNEPYNGTGTSGSGASVWYLWQADSDGEVTFDTEGGRTNYDSVMAIYSGDSLSSLEQLSMNDGEGNYSRVTINATAGVTYRLAVDGYFAAQGDFVLNWRRAACVEKATQSISFAPLADRTYGDAPFTVSAASSSGLPVTLSVLSGPATINGETVTINGAGSVTIRASQAGDANYNPAANVDRSFVVNKGQATLTLSGLSHIYNGLAKRATVATSPAGLSSVAISYSQNGVAVAAPVNAGSYVVRASLSNSKYQAADVTATLVIAKASQTISFAPLANRAYGSGSFNVAATSSSRLPVSFRIVSGPAKISGSTVTITGVGTVVVRASQLGNGNYNAAAYVDRSFTATKAAQTISFNLLPSKTYGEAPFVLSATSSSGLPVTFQLVSGPATLTGNKLTLTGVGKVTVRATQAGNINYNAAVAINRAFDVTSAQPNITLRGLAFTYDGKAKSATVLTKPAGLKVTVSYSQNGVNVAPLKAGSYKVLATINDANYRATATGTLVINKARPVITWANPAAVAPGAVLGAAQLNATANVPGTFKYAPAAGLVMGAGSYQLSVTFTPTDAANYAAVTKSVKLTVSPTTARALSPDIGPYVADVAIDTIDRATFLVRLAEVQKIFSLPVSLLPAA